MPKVSITITAYNRENYIGPCIDSLLNQSFSDFEIIVVNDGSTDKTVEVVEAYSDPRIKLYHNEKNMGIVFTRNRGFELSTGEFIAILDSDDLALPNRLEHQVHFLDNHPNTALVGAFAEVIDENGQSEHKIWFSNFNQKSLKTRLFFENCIAQSSVMLRKSSLPQPAYRPDYPPSEDFDLWVRISQNWEVSNLSKVLIQYRVHSKNISKEENSIQVDNANKILIYQAENLIGSVLTENEKSNHLSLMQNKYVKTDDMLNIHKWVFKLLEANKLKKKYSEIEFESILTEKWIQSFYRIPKFNTSLIPLIFTRFSKSFGRIQKLKFFVKCLLGINNKLVS